MSEETFEYGKIIERQEREAKADAITAITEIHEAIDELNSLIDQRLHDLNFSYVLDFKIKLDELRKLKNK